MRRLLLFACMLVPACFVSTPFKDKPEATDLTRQELRSLERLGEPPESWTFLAFGDTHDDYDNLERSVGLMNQATDARFALIAGDLTDRGTLQEFEWSGELYQELEMPFLTVIGNHDAISDGRSIYEQMYGPRNYSFRQGSLKFVMFDSNTLETPSAPARDWLTAQVTDHGDASGVVLVTHQSITAPDDLEGGTNRAFYDELLQGGDVVLVIHGHLDEQRLRLVHGVPVLQCGTYETHFQHTFVDFDGASFGFRSCVFEDCQAIEPEPEPEAEPTMEAP
jgi:predicted phosphodiesterase